METSARIERRVVDGLRKQDPIRDLPGVSIRGVRGKPEQPFDVSFELASGRNRVQVLGEIKAAFTPRLLEEIAPWIKRLKALRPEMAVAVIAPVLSSQAQAFCLENTIDFLDLAGNISIHVPGKFTLQRTGIRNRDLSAPSGGAPGTINVFSGRSSRVLRVLLEKPKIWSITGLAREIAHETARFRQITPAVPVSFTISLGAISKAVATLQEQLLVRRRGTEVVVPEPARLLREWAEKYKERYRWRLRSSFQANNPFGRDLESIGAGLEKLKPAAYALSGAMAASVEAPFVDIEMIDVFITSDQSDAKLRNLNTQPSVGPALRFIYPYDAGVFMYAQRIGKAVLVSPVQAYLDLYARGGRDLKQADFLLENSIRRRWSAA